MNKASKPRLEWVDYAKGICVFAVVILYSTMLAAELLGDAGWLQYWTDFARPFRMPDFFLLSGLFLGKVIDKPWRGYLDKKFVHYLYFFFLWTFINLLILFAVGTLNGGVSDFFRELFMKSTSWPWMMLWFIQMLPAYFLFTKLTHRIPVWIVFLVAALLQAYPPIFESVVHAIPLLQGDRVLVDDFWTRYVFFFAGYAGAPYFFKIAEFAKNRVLLAVIGLIVWGVVNSNLVQLGIADKPFVGLFLGLAGASAVITLGSIASKFRFARWLRYLGEHSIVVYLAFYWPMQLAAVLLVNVSALTYDHGTFGMIITLAGVFGSVALFSAVKRSPYTDWLFKRPTQLYVGEYETKPTLKSRQV